MSASPTYDVGSNVTYVRSPQLLQKILNLLRYAPSGLGKQGKLCYKDGAPVSDTAADAPNALYDICYDYTNSDVYVCTAYTHDESFTWTKIA